ncbi:aromatic amino acid ammonia-lyase [Spirillospora sp. NPDC049652]
MKLWLNGHDLRMSEVVAVARGLRPVGLAADAAQRMTASQRFKERLVAEGRPVYGVTSGFGDSATRQIHGDKAAELQANLLRFLNCGTGPLATAEVLRATLLVRANCLARGYSGVRPDLVRLLLDCLATDILPAIPERGSVGASGDLVPLSYLARMLTGEGEVIFAGRRMPAADALAQAGLTPLPLQSKEGLALVNGTSFMSAYAVLAAAEAREVAHAAELGTAMTTQVLLGEPDHFADFVFRHKPHPGALASASGIRAFLGLDGHGEPLAAEEADASWMSRGYRQMERSLQDRYSMRCAPHVVGALRDMLATVDDLTTIEINSSNDNPLFDYEHGVVRNGGNFYGSHIGLATDALKTAVASVADLLDRQLELVVDEKFNNGLPPNLIPRYEPGSRDEGLHHGFKGMQLTSSALAAEALNRTMPATSFSRSTEAHNQDKVSMGTIAARGARDVVELAVQVAAIHLIALCQAADLRGHEVLSPRTATAHAFIRKHSPALDADRPLADDIARVAETIRSGELRDQLGG